MITDTMQELFEKHPEGLSIPFLCETLQCSVRRCYDIMGSLRRKRWPIRMVNGLYKIEGKIPENHKRKKPDYPKNRHTGSRKKDIALGLLQSAGDNGIRIKSMGTLLSSSPNSARAFITNLRKNFRIDSQNGYYIYRGSKKDVGDSKIKPVSKPPVSKPPVSKSSVSSNFGRMILSIDEETNKLIKDLPQDLQRFIMNTINNVRKCNEIIGIYSDLYKIRKEILWNGQND